MKKIDKKFFERLNEIYTKTDVEIIKNSMNLQKDIVVFRVNNIKSDKQKVIEALNKNNISFEEVGYIEDAFICRWIPKRKIWDLDIYKNGEIYMQSISSQIPALFFDLKVGDKILDLTAAPGSKTTQIASILKNDVEIIACDNSFVRLEKLKHNLEKQWVEKVEVKKCDVRNISEILKDEKFDKIVADLPCSAEWRINFNNEKSFWFWSEQNIKKNYKLQKDILKSAVELLKVWGELIYSTCTLAPEENEAIVHFLLSNFKDLKIVDIWLDTNLTRPWITKFDWKVFNKQVKKAIRFLPSWDTEWFFIAKFVRV